MGGEESSTNNQQENELVDNIISAEDLQKVENSKHKPSPKYAKLAKQVPNLNNKVDQVKRRINAIKQSKKVEKGDNPQYLPWFQMVLVPTIFYRGEWFNGKQHGKGEVITKNGIYFNGEFVYGSAECEEGLVIFPDGSYYLGNFKDNRFEGKGKFESPYKKKVQGEEQGEKKERKTIYEGEWKNNLPHGKGKETYEDGSNYNGDWENGVKHGRGRFEWVQNGQIKKVYEGEFYNGEMHGQGKLFAGPKGEFFYQGKFEHGLKVSTEDKPAQIKTPYGTYTGRFQNGLMHGTGGKFEWKDGKVYVGGFEFGEMHGVGKLTVKDNVISGQWKRGENVKIQTLLDKK